MDAGRRCLKAGQIEVIKPRDDGLLRQCFWIDGYDFRDQKPRSPKGTLHQERDPAVGYLVIMAKVSQCRGERDSVAYGALANRNRREQMVTVGRGHSLKGFADRSQVSRCC